MLAEVGASFGAAPLAALLLAPLIVLAAYTLFGITGFGSSITAVPLLAQFFPLTFVVPLMVLFDLGASLILGGRNRAAIDRRELLRIVPFMLAGIAVGTSLLLHVPQRWLMLALGVFVLAYAAWGMAGRVSNKPLSPWWAIPIGGGGGIASALFGTGGPVYAIYLARRLPDKAALRATVTTVVSLSGITRLLVFVLAGFYFQQGVLPWVLLLMPFMLGGLWLGNRLHDVLPVTRVVQALWTVLLVGGASLVVRSATL